VSALTGPSILVGCMPDDRGDDAVALAGALARQLGWGVTLAYVRPESWPGTPVGAVDAEWAAFLRAEADQILEGAARRLGVVAPDVPFNRTVTDEILVCSVSDAGPLTRVFVGDVSSKIIRSAGVPVAVFPRGARLDVWR
jgi:nucleotide-binding universal stress UspA family protein